MPPKSMIEINNLTTSRVDEEFFKKTAKIVLEGEYPPLGRVPKGANLSVALVGQGRMRALNKKYRKRNRITDVLAFPQSKTIFDKFKIKSLQKIEGLGEIVICLKEVKKNAKRYGTTFEKELAKVLIHGILHLLGYDHEKSEMEAEKMEEKENYYLSQVNL